MLLRSICILSLLSCAAIAGEPVTLKGVIMDKDSAPEASIRVLSTGIQGGMVVAEAHDRDALLKKEAVKSGYGLYTRDDKFYEFDIQGSEKALAAVKASKKLVDFEAEVTGEVTGNTIKVKSLKLIEQ